MKIIKTKKNESIYVDDWWFKILNNFSWYLSNKGYAVRGNGRNGQKRMIMHRIVNNTPTNKFTDHINGNKRDNREINLRICDDMLNRANVPKFKIKKRGKSYSQFKGVCFNYKRIKPSYLARIRYNKKLYILGTFKTEKMAAITYNAVAVALFGDFANTNKI